MRKLVGREEPSDHSQSGRPCVSLGSMYSRRAFRLLSETTGPNEDKEVAESLSLNLRLSG